MEKEIEHPSHEVNADPQGFLISLKRQTFYFLLLGCLLLPMIIVVGYAINVGTVGLFFMTLLSLIIGGGAGWYVLRFWEQKMRTSVSQLVKFRLQNMGEGIHSLPQHTDTLFYQEELQRLQKELEETRRGYEHQIDLLQSSVVKSKDQVRQLNLEMDKKLEQMRVAYLEFEDLRKEYHRLEEDYLHVQEEAQKAIKHKDSLINEYQRTVSEQRMIIEKKQRYIAKLETKVKDLMYEIRSLLQLEESTVDPKPLVDQSDQSMIEYYLPPAGGQTTPYDLSLQLHRYIEKAENLTGVDHLGYVGGKSPRFLDMSFDSYAIDRRRLFEYFKDETSEVVFIYSQAEKKFLFVNYCVKTILGWSPEKFIKEFPRLVTKGYAEWEEALATVRVKKEVQTRLAILNKSGEKRAFECYLGLITKGPFTNHVIGIFV